MDNAKIEEIYNQTFGGLTLFYRDTNLDQEFIDNYEIGQILIEKGFTDATFKGGGLTGNLRYLIASNQGRDVSSVMPNMADYGLVMLTSGAFFKVLDVCKVEGKNQVLLLHIEQQNIEFFRSATSNIEAQIVERARANFDEKLRSEPLPRLQTQEWKQRTEFPIGMSENGKFLDFGNELNPEGKPWWKFW